MESFPLFSAHYFYEVGAFASAAANPFASAAANPTLTALLAVAAPVAMWSLWSLKRIVGTRSRRGPPRIVGKVVRLFRYPVKSMAGIEMEAGEVDVGGFVHDREWCLVRAPPVLLAPTTRTTDPHDESRTNLHPSTPVLPVTIREVPAMATIQPSFTADGELVLTVPNGSSPITVRAPASPITIDVLIWRSVCSGFDQGDEVADFLTAFCAAQGVDVGKVRLLRMRDPARRLSVDPKYAPMITESETLAERASRFSDWSPFTIITTQTLKWVRRSVRGVDDENALASMAAPNRFRANIVVDCDECGAVGVEAPSGTGGGSGRLFQTLFGGRKQSRPFQEDAWRTYSVGCVGMRFLKQAGRCMVTTVCPDSGVRNTKLEPLRLLKQKRRGEYPCVPPGSEFYDGVKEAFLSVNVLHELSEKNQWINVGDWVTVQEFE